MAENSQHRPAQDSQEYAGAVIPNSAWAVLVSGVQWTRPLPPYPADTV